MVALRRMLLVGSLFGVVLLTPCARILAQTQPYATPQSGPSITQSAAAAPSSAAPAGLPPLVNTQEKINGLPSVLPNGTLEFPAPTTSQAAIAAANGDVLVRDVRIEGNHSTSTSKMPKLRTRVGEPFDSHIVEEDSRNLAQSHKFLDVRPQVQPVPGGMAVIFQVVERPIMEHIDFVGNQDFRTQTLRKKSELEVKQPLDPYAVEEAKRRIEEYYKEDGYNHAQVVIKEGLNPGDRGVTFQISEGEQEKVWWVSFEGNTIASDSRLRTQIEEKPGFMWLFGGKVDRKKVDDDLQKLYAYYRGLGFFKAKIAPDLAYNEAHHWLSIKYIIDEGPRYTIRNISFLGNEKFKVAELNKNLEETVGKPFDQPTLNHDLNGIRDVYGSHGYVFADVQAKTVLLEDQPQMDLIYEVAEGKQYRVGKININIGGDTPHTNHQVILNRMTLRPGDIIDTKKLRDDERRLKFASVFNADPTKGGAPKITFSKPDGLKDEQVADRGSNQPASGARSARANDSSGQSGSGSGSGNGSGSGYGSGGPGNGSDYGGTYRGQSPDDVEVIDGTITSDGAGHDYIVLTPRQPPKMRPASNIAGGDISRARFQDPGSSQGGVRLVSGASDWQGTGNPQSAADAANYWNGPSGSSYLPRGAQPLSPGNVTSPFSPPIGVAPAVGSQPNPAAAAPQYPRYSNAVYPTQPVPTQNASMQGGSYPGGGTPQAGDGFSSAPNLAGPNPSGAPSYSAPGFQPQNYPPIGQAPPALQSPAAQPQFAQAPGYQPMPQPGYQTPPPPQSPIYQSPPSQPPIYQTPPNPQQPMTPMPSLPGDVAIQPLGEPQQFLPIDINAAETQTGRLMLGVGVNSDAGLVGNFVLDEQNFDIQRLPRSWEDVTDGVAWRGGAQRLRLEANPGTLVQRYAATFQQPYLFETGGGWVSFDVSGFYFTRIYQDWSEARTGGKVGFGYMFAPDFTGRVAFDGERVTIYNPHNPTPPLLLRALGQNDRYGFTVGVANDTRDSPFIPSQGHLLSVNFEQVVGTFDYPHIDIEGRQYFTLHERADHTGRHTLGIGGQFGLTADNTPIYDNYFAGGFSTLRGFAFRGASPLQENVQVGGNVEALGTVEYMFPITADDALRGVAFCDFGTVEQSKSQGITSNGFRVAPGVGLRINVAAMGPAPIALDLAFPIVSQPGDQIQTFSFFVGLGR